tara:strand:+ start:987 stop:1313 length:327 start_codon:yes stop_codon:yes gene_type:complete
MKKFCSNDKLKILLDAQVKITKIQSPVWKFAQYETGEIATLAVRKDKDCDLEKVYGKNIFAMVVLTDVRYHDLVKKMNEATRVPAWLEGAKFSRAVPCCVTGIEVLVQ